MCFAHIDYWCSIIDESTQSADSYLPRLSSEGTSGVQRLQLSRELYDRALEILAHAPSGLDASAAASILFRAKALKKWKLPIGNSQSRRDEACQGFVRRNDAAGQRHLPSWMIYIMSRILRYWLPEQSVLPMGTFGPGACAEHWSHLKRFERLYDWCTASAHWPECPAGVRDADHVTSRLCAVPKDWYRDRLITVEPAYGTFAQQYVRTFILESIHAGPLRGTCFDQLYVDAPLRQRRLALDASRTGSLCTIDLSDASDGIAWADVQSVFPPWVVRLLEVTRSTHFEYSGRSYPTLIYAGMGNATTFIVETLFFAAVCLAISERNVLSGSFRAGRSVSVFGDDVIAPSSLLEFLRKHGDYPWFRLNSSKSFGGDDSLRESCGIFAFKGVDITVPKVDGYTDNWFGRLGLSDLYWRTREKFPHVASSIAASRVLPNYRFIPLGYPCVSDARYPYDAVPRMRWNSDYCRWEGRFPVLEPRYRYIPTRAYSGPGLRPEHLYNACLASMIHTDGSGHYVKVPLGTFKTRNRWLPIRLCADWCTEPAVARVNDDAAAGLSSDCYDRRAGH